MDRRHDQKDKSASVARKMHQKRIQDPSLKDDIYRKRYPMKFRSDTSRELVMLVGWILLALIVGLLGAK